MQVYEACLARAWRLSDAVLPQLRRATDAATSLAAEGEAAKTERRRCEQLTAAAEAEVTQANLRLSKFRRERAQSEVALLAAHAKGQRLEEALAEARGDSARLVKAAEAAGLELQVLLPLPSLQVLFVAPPCGCLCPPLPSSCRRRAGSTSGTRARSPRRSTRPTRRRKPWSGCRSAGPTTARCSRRSTTSWRRRASFTPTLTPTLATHHSHLPTPTRLSLSQLSLSLNALNSPPTGARVDCEARAGAVAADAQGEAARGRDRRAARLGAEGR